MKMACVSNPGLTSTSGVFAIAALPAPPAAPTNLAAKLVTSGPRKRPTTSVQLTWVASVGAKTYTVYRNGAVVVSGLTNVNWQDSAKLSSGSYNYNVKAVDSANQSSPLSNTANVVR